MKKKINHNFEQLKEELENINNDNVRNVEALRKTVMLLENELNELKVKKQLM